MTFEQKLLKEELENVLKEIERKGRIIENGYKVEFNSINETFRVWYKRPDGFCRAFSGICSAQQLKDSIKYYIIKNRSYVCNLCKFYNSKHNGCEKSKACIEAVACKDFEYGEFPPSDALLAKTIAKVKDNYKTWFSPGPLIHEKVDDILLTILSRIGYEKSVEKIRKINIGFDHFPVEDESVRLNELIEWICIFCRNHSKLDGVGCFSGLDEGWHPNNDCKSFSLIGTPISDNYFEDLIDLFLAEMDDSEVNTETIHYNIDLAICYLFSSLGYPKTVKEYSSIEKHYLSIPF